MRLPRLLLAIALTLSGFAQTPAQDPPQPLPDPSAPQSTAPETKPQTTDPNAVHKMEETPTYRVNVVERTTQAVNYRSRSGATKINFRGTDLLPKANGEAKVESKKGYTEIEVEFDDLEKATRYGNEYLTYVLWGITPEGRATNLGELVMSGNRGKLNVTTELQAFGMIVTAEPYFAVTQPSNLVVLENEVRPDTVGGVQRIKAKYSLIDVGGYRPENYTFEPMVPKPKLPGEFYQAQNAMRIAKATGAEKYAESPFARAENLYEQALDYANRKNVERKPLITTSRAAVQSFEDARLISLRRQDEERRENERQARARAEEEAAASARRQKDAEEIASLRRAEAERATAEAARATKERAEAEAARQTALTQQQQAEELARLRAAEAERDRLAATEAEQKRLQAEREQEELRARLLQQFNLILETRDTARGLVVNLSDVLFDFGKSSLRPLAREKLARLSGILLSYPGLKIQVEGHTDNIGSDAYNQRLSEQRAAGVLSYLTSQGVLPANVTAIGLGKTQPVADNSTAKGRQQNRRVEMVVSGEVIGTKIGPTATPQPTTQQTPPAPPPPR